MLAKKIERQIFKSKMVNDPQMSQSKNDSSSDSSSSESSGTPHVENLEE